MTTDPLADRQRRTAGLAVAVLALALLVAPLAAATAPAAVAGSGSDRTSGTDAGPAIGSGQDDNGTDVSPGERLAGTIGAEQASLDGEVAERRFGVELARAETNASAAGVVADRLDAVGPRLDALEQRLDGLERARENGSIGTGTYAVRIAVLEVERASLARQLNHTAAAADGLPAEALGQRGVDAAAIGSLRDRANDFGGRAVRDLAREIAGPGVGQGLGPGEHVPGDVPGVDDVTDRGERGPDDRPGTGDVDGADSDGAAADGTAGDGTADRPSGDGGADTGADGSDDRP